MSQFLPGTLPKKSAKRTRIVDEILGALRQDRIFRTLDYRRKSEAYLKQYMHQPLMECVEGIHRRLAPSVSEARTASKARRSLRWEGDVNTTVNHVRFMGVQHRPDFVIGIEGLEIAVEVKRGESGAAVREGVGQSLVYVASCDFHFVVYLFVDTSRDQKVLASVNQQREKAFIDSLWMSHNIRFGVV